LDECEPFCIQELVPGAAGCAITSQTTPCVGCFKHDRSLVPAYFEGFYKEINQEPKGTCQPRPPFYDTFPTCSNACDEICDPEKSPSGKWCLKCPKVPCETQGLFDDMETCTSFCSDPPMKGAAKCAAKGHCFACLTSGGTTIPFDFESFYKELKKIFPPEGPSVVTHPTETPACQPRSPWFDTMPDCAKGCESRACLTKISPSGKKCWKCLDEEMGLTPKSPTTPPGQKPTQPTTPGGPQVPVQPDAPISRCAKHGAEFKDSEIECDKTCTHSDWHCNDYSFTDVSGPCYRCDPEGGWPLVRTGSTPTCEEKGLFSYSVDCDSACYYNGGGACNNKETAPCWGCYGRDGELMRITHFTPKVPPSEETEPELKKQKEVPKGQAGQQGPVVTEPQTPPCAPQQTELDKTKKLVEENKLQCISFNPFACISLGFNGAKMNNAKKLLDDCTKRIGPPAKQKPAPNEPDIAKGRFVPLPGPAPLKPAK